MKNAIECSQAEILTAASADLELGAKDRDLLESHLAQCERCMNAWLVLALDTAEISQASVHDLGQWRAALAQDETQPKAGHKNPQAGWIVGLVLAAAAAILFAVFQSRPAIDTQVASLPTDVPTASRPITEGPIIEEEAVTRASLRAEIDELRKEQEDILNALKGLAPNENPSTSELVAERLTREQVEAAIDRARPSIRACGQQNPSAVTVSVWMRIGSDGVVSEAKPSGGSDALNACTARVVEMIVFPPSVKGMTVTYPFVFR